MPIEEKGQIGWGGAKVKEWTDGGRGFENHRDTQEALAGGSPSRGEGVGAAAVVFLSQVIPRNSSLLSFPF